MHNVDDILTEAARYNASIWFHCASWAIKTLLDHLNEVNNGFTWIKCFTQRCNNMAKSGIFKIIDGKKMQKLQALFRVEEHFPLLKKDNRQLPYFLISN